MDARKFASADGLFTGAFGVVATLGLLASSACALYPETPTPSATVAPLTIVSPTAVPTGAAEANATATPFAATLTPTAAALPARPEASPTVAPQWTGPEPNAALTQASVESMRTAAGTAIGIAPAGRTHVCRPAEPVSKATPGRSVIVDRGAGSCSTVALTFDAGADRGYAELILDILREKEVPASFGMTGQWAEKNSDLVKRISNEGHQLINHTWSHRSFTGNSPRTRPLSAAERRAELERTESLLQALTGRDTRPYFRPPYGDQDSGVLKDLADAGYDYTIMWTVDSLGWNHLPTRAIVERCLSRAAPGAIYLFHVGAESQDAQALGPTIEGLRARGFDFVTVEDLLGL